MYLRVGNLVKRARAKGRIIFLLSGDEGNPCYPAHGHKLNNRWRIVCPRSAKLTVREAISFFSHVPRIASKLRVLEEVGLGYLRLGQSATTLSGGEAQRVKLASYLSKRTGDHSLYIFDEPTTTGRFLRQQ